jgi:ubiquinone/menaquinone biosynthesis C-methylase UbiE
MCEEADTSPSARYPWESYWRAGDNPHAAAVMGVGSSDAFRSVWDAFLNQIRVAPGNVLRVLDLACGAGVVTEQARAVLPAGTVFVGADYAVSAVNQFSARFGGKANGVFSVAADGACLPFANGAFDIVVSQFGLEYAGLGAFAEVGRVIANNGDIMCVAHYRDGAIEFECRESLRIADEIFMSKVFEKMQVFFETAGNREAEQNLASALQRLQFVMAASPPSPGLDLLSQLGADLTRLAMRRAAFESREIYAWLEAALSELSQYSARMRAMVSAALSEGEVRGIMDAWKAGGLEVDMPLPVVTEATTEPSAWQLSAHRPKA